MKLLMYVATLFWVSSLSHASVDSDGLVIEEATPIISKYFEGIGHYQGEISDDFFHGQGVLTKDDGTILRGEWLYGQQHGNGEYIGPFGCASYKGGFYNDVMQGEGVYAFKGIGTIKAQFANNEMVGKGQCECGDLSFKCTHKEFGELCMIPSLINGNISEECTKLLKNGVKKHTDEVLSAPNQ